MFPLIFCLTVFGLWILLKMRVSSRPQPVKLVDQSTMVICSCKREVSQNQFVSDHGVCIYCILENHDLQEEFQAFDEKKPSRVVIAIPKPKPEEV